MNLLAQVFIRVLAFVRKELVVAIRQPRLILSLVLGPFLILGLFGIGYQGQNHYNTILVMPNREGISTNPADYKEVFKDTFQVTEISKDEATARAALDRNAAEVVIVVPGNALDEIYNGRSAKFPIYYRTVNPLQANFIEYSTYVYASEFDKVVLREALQASKPQTSQLQESSRQLNSSSDGLDRAMQSNNLVEAKFQVQRMKTVVQLSRSTVDSLILPGASKDKSVQNNLIGGQLTNNIFKTGVGQIQGDLDNIDNRLTALDSGFNRGDANSAQQRSNLDSIRQSNQSLSDKSNKVANIPPAVLVEPVLSDAKNLVSTKVSYLNFYGPAVIILLLQHIAITLVSLSNVRDRLIGTMEIFRVAPIGPGQIMTGKFISFAIMLLVLSGLLIVLITQALGVPFINFDTTWLTGLAVLAVTIYSSIGLGFLIAGLSRTESQAVQLSMIFLLASIFFTGFVVPLTLFTDLIRYVGYVLPMTFGTAGLQSVMLDARPLDPFYLLVPLALGTVYLVLARLLYQRQFKIS